MRSSTDAATYLSLLPRRLPAGIETHGRAERQEEAYCTLDGNLVKTHWSCDFASAATYQGHAGEKENEAEALDGRQRGSVANALCDVQIKALATMAKQTRRRPKNRFVQRKQIRAVRVCPRMALSSQPLWW